jgi:hypothetical protein
LPWFWFFAFPGLFVFVIWFLVLSGKWDLKNQEPSSNKLKAKNQKLLRSIFGFHIFSYFLVLVIWFWFFSGK